MMKNFALSFIFVSIIFRAAFSGHLGDDEEIAKINSKVDSIQIITANTEPLITDVNEHEKLYAFYGKGHILKIQVSVKSESKKQVQEYYFEKGFLILIIEKNYDVNDSEMKESIEIIRYYFKHDKMICWLENDLTEAPHNEVFNSTEKMWLDKTDKYLLMIQ